MKKAVVSPRALRKLGEFAKEGPVIIPVVDVTETRKDIVKKATKRTLDQVEGRLHENSGMKR